MEARHAPRKVLRRPFAEYVSFGQAEIGSLQLSELHLNKPHPVFKTDVGNYVRRLRGKTKVVGDWKLWDETVQAIKWILRRRPKTTVDNMYVKPNGKPLKKTKGGNRDRSTTCWLDLWERIKANDTKDFPWKSYGKLRKTGINAVRESHGGEVAELMASHGVPYDGDPLLEVYSNRPFIKLYEALDAWRQKLTMFAAVENPFHDEPTRGNRKYAQTQIKRIVPLREQGLTQEAISKETGIPVASVAYP